MGEKGGCCDRVEHIFDDLFSVGGERLRAYKLLCTRRLEKNATLDLLKHTDPSV